MAGESLACDSPERCISGIVANDRPAEVYRDNGGGNA
jgi:hypothetical protein